MTLSGTRILLAVLALALFADSVSAAGVTLPPFHRFELDNGTVLLLSQKPEVPMVSVTAILRGGAVADPPGHGDWRTCWRRCSRKAPGIAMRPGSRRPSTPPAACSRAAPTSRP